MERVLRVYSRPYNPAYPVICFDERPCFLIGDVLAPLPVEPGRVAREDYEYEKFGNCAVLMAVEPLTGRRWVEIGARRTAKEYAEFMRRVESDLPEAVKITLLQDNLNIHHGGSFYKWVSAEEALRLTERFEWVYTPKHASWLNMAEIEFSAMSRQCLNRRIPTVEKLSEEVKSWVEERNCLRIKLNWQFTVEDARLKMARHYGNIRT